MVGSPGLALPTGEVTFVLTDIVGSTALLDEIGLSRFRALLTNHHRILVRAIEQHGGVCFKSEGDGMMIAFADPGSALCAAVAGQRALAEHDWAPERPPSVRMAVHRGEALVEADDYISMALHQGARLMGAPHGGQVICTGEVLAELALPPLGLRSRLLGGYWVRDFRDAVPLYQVDDDGGDSSEFPALRLPRADLTNITEDGRLLIGRDELIDDVVGAVRSARVVTLIGPGGVGKTSVAVEVARRVAEDGEAAWLVELAPVEILAGEDTEVVELRLVAAVARSIGMSVEAKPAVLARLASRSVLLVLDNCEHVVDAAASLVAAVIAACPQARVLVTSREPLRLVEETVLEVPLLTLARADATLAELTASAPVQLFERRARKGNPDFRVTAQNASAVAALCRQLDGLPLALELAGTSTRHLSPADMLERLEAVGSLPARGAGRRVARHDSLTAVVQWSLGSCTDEQVAIFRRMGAFAGPATLDAVAAVCGSGSAKWDVLDALGVLIDKSLVVMRVEEDLTRYDMLVTMRRAARGLLAEADEGDDALRWHADWVVARTAEIEERSAAEHRAAEAELVPETMLVLDRAERIGLPLDHWVALANSSILRLGIRAPEQARRLAAHLLARTDLNPSQRSHLFALRVRSWGLEGVAAEEIIAEAVTAARAADEPRDLAIALIATAQGSSGYIDVSEQRVALSPECAEIEVLCARLDHDERIEMVFRSMLGIQYAQMSDLEAARQQYAIARDMSIRLADRFNEGVMTYNIAEVDELSGDDAAALAGHTRAAETFARGGYHLQNVYAALGCCQVLERADDLETAGTFAADAVLEARRSGSRGLLAHALVVAMRIALAADDAPLALANAREILALDPPEAAALAAREAIADLGGELARAFGESGG